MHLHLGISRGHGHGRPHGRHSAAEPPRCPATPSTAVPSFDCDLAQEPAASPSPPATLAVEQELRALAAQSPNPAMPSSHRNRPPRRAPVHDLAEPPQAKPRRSPRRATTSVSPLRDVLAVVCSEPGYPRRPGLPLRRAVPPSRPRLRARRGHQPNPVRHDDVPRRCAWTSLWCATSSRASTASSPPSSFLLMRQSRSPRQASSCPRHGHQEPVPPCHREPETTAPSP
ncbi:elongin BC and Polycomb repressive complex 2-associated protein-like [Sorghum bicolor]|uniref:elongin BC and Polycomb repressive complex 2-associated protein-like n=1 Tax=Sorghum bicolor TaxID=4558 RepID=UPI000B426713|nr:elongin BC and Polycomb repressive complex 2-associated protein-like [Sorghum bicolor]|eukprot:XP_021317750.1 elongin BC and Polycomb repressive complex 2-associated protein-like [Sorghum bicolor]